jgi:hypothetical protein
MIWWLFGILVDTDMPPFSVQGGNQTSIQLQGNCVCCDTHPTVGQSSVRWSLPFHLKNSGINLLISTYGIPLFEILGSHSRRPDSWFDVGCCYLLVIMTWYVWRCSLRVVNLKLSLFVTLHLNAVRDTEKKYLYFWCWHHPSQSNGWLVPCVKRKLHTFVRYFSSNRHSSLPCQIFMPPPLTCNFVRCCAFLPSSCKVAEFAPGRIPELWTIQEVWSFLFETKISVVKRNPLIISAGTRHVPKGDQQFPYFLAAGSLVPSSRYSFKYTRTKRELYTLKFALRTVD